MDAGNSITLIGRLTRDAELRYVVSGDPVANFTLAVDRPFKNQAGERGVDFIPVVAWRKLGELVAQYTGKGHQVAVQGRLQMRSYETQDGQRRTVAEVMAASVKFLGAPRNGTGKGNGGGHGAEAAAPEAPEVEPEPEEIPAE